MRRDALLRACLVGSGQIVAASAGLRPVVAVDAMVVGDGLLDCAAIVHDGRVLGVVPKAYLPITVSLRQADISAAPNVGWRTT